MINNITTIVTHANCGDGIASAIILKYAYPLAEVVFLSYNTPEHAQLEAKPGMLFCDMTPPRERVQEFVDAGAWVLDHHKYAKDIVAAFGERGVFADEDERPGVSGATLAYEAAIVGNEDALFLHREALYEIQELAAIRDTWQREHPRWRDACALNQALKLYGLKADENSWVWVECLFSRMDTGYALLAKHEAKIAERHEAAWTYGSVLIHQDVELTSDIAEFDQGTEHPHDIVAGFAYIAERLVVSMRSNKINVGTIAHAHGGGGHKKAAGFSMPISDRSPFVEILRALGHGADFAKAWNAPPTVVHAEVQS